VPLRLRRRPSHPLTLCVQLNRFFRVEFLGTRIIVLTRDALKELFSASEDELSFVRSSSESVELKYTFHDRMAVDHYHAVVTRMQLSRHIPQMMPDIVDELSRALEDEVAVGDGTQLLRRCVH
jgi:hypothetical protein